MRVCDLLADCICDRANEPWRQLLSHFDENLRRHFFAKSLGARQSDYEEFCAFFPGWLLLHRKLETMYASVCAEHDPTPEYAENYFGRIIASGVAEFHRRDRLIGGPGLSVDCEREADHSRLELAEKLDELVEVIQQLKIDVRVPFKLRFYTVLGNLTGEEEVWLAKQAELSVKTLRRAIDREASENAGRSQPLKTPFLAAALGISRAAVDQRIYRAKQLIRAGLGVEV